MRDAARGRVGVLRPVGEGALACAGALQLALKVVRPAPELADAGAQLVDAARSRCRTGAHGAGQVCGLAERAVERCDAAARVGDRAVELRQPALLGRSTVALVQQPVAGLPQLAGTALDRA